jgi:hypothetical protein
MLWPTRRAGNRENQGIASPLNKRSTVLIIAVTLAAAAGALLALL